MIRQSLFAIAIFSILALAEPPAFNKKKSIFTHCPLLFASEIDLVPLTGAPRGAYLLKGVISNAQLDELRNKLYSEATGRIIVRRVALMSNNSVAVTFAKHLEFGTFEGSEVINLGDANSYNRRLPKGSDLKIASPKMEISLPPFRTPDVITVESLNFPAGRPRDAHSVGKIVSDEQLGVLRSKLNPDTDGRLVIRSIALLSNNSVAVTFAKQIKDGRMLGNEVVNFGNATSYNQRLPEHSDLMIFP